MIQKKLCTSTGWALINRYVYKKPRVQWWVLLAISEKVQSKRVSHIVWVLKLV